MTNTVRRQLTLFVDKADTEEIDAIRQKFNPIQYRLIGCHVTLCYEEEIQDISKVLDNLKTLKREPLTIQFNKAIRFDNGKGVLMPGVKNNVSFDQLRAEVLKDTGSVLRQVQPHITLIHPRNAVCTDEIFSTIMETALPSRLTFSTISMIEQVDTGQWQTIRVFNLN
ncbi:MAG: 2'-5' RNA ligase family protein [Bacteroidetes bacterium]|nr:2'-5' RNA ligase family protein [Bacteroidota bacterium]